MPRANLILVNHPAAADPADLHRIAQHIAPIDPALRCFVLPDRPLSRWSIGRTLRLRSAPTLLISMIRCDHLCPPRGKIFQGHALSKSDELTALARCNIPVPDFELITADHRPDLFHLGHYVVVKPNNGGRGAYVRIMKHHRVRWERTETRISGKSDELLAQRFIYTGQWPVHYRVTTLFGEALFCYRTDADRSRRPLQPDMDFRQAGGVSIVSSGRNCTMALCDEEQIIRLGEAAHAAFPNHPLLGIDIIREQPSGKLYVLEVNSSGYVWHFSSKLGLEFQQEFSFNLESQFDGLRKAAGILAQATRRLAV